MSPRIEKYLSGEIAIVPDVELDAKGQEVWAVWPADFPGLIARGNSRVQAIRNLMTMLPGALAALEDAGMAIPAPTVRASISFLRFGVYNPETGLMGGQSLAPGDLPDPFAGGQLATA